MKVVTLNVNGIRSAIQKGLLPWIESLAPDIVCLQEMRISKNLLAEGVYAPKGYHAYFSPALKKGYSGVALWSKQPALRITEGLGFSLCDEEGRYIIGEWEHCKVASIYFPSGTSGCHRQEEKYRFMAEIEERLLKPGLSRCILAGDWNIAHTYLDIKNAKANEKNSGFLPAERAWLDKCFGELKWADAFRVIHPTLQKYTWWSQRGRAYENDVGWRIDYQVVSPDLRDKIVQAEIFRTPKFSDHAPFLVEYAV